MKRKILIIIVYILSIIISILGFLYYKKSFLSNNKKEVQTIKKYGDDINYVYLCNNYNYSNISKNKQYSLKNNNNCIKYNISCKNCKIETNYYNDTLIYYSDNNKINIYNIKDHTLLDEIDTTNINDVRLYGKNDELYGFVYFDTEGKHFYNLELKKTTVNFKNNQRICHINTSESGYKYCDDNNHYIDGNNDLTIISENKTDSVITTYGLINLKTGKIVLDPTKSNIFYQYERYLAIEDSLEEVYDYDGKLLFINDKISNNPYYANIIQIISKGYYLVITDDYICIINDKGNILSNSKIKINKIKEDIKNNITNTEAKKRCDFNSNDIDSSNLDAYFDEYQQTITISFSYEDKYYSIYEDMYYEYNINTQEVNTVEDFGTY